MERDNIRYVQKCHQCQAHGDFIRVPPNELNVMGSPWPFTAWGIDLIGPIDTNTSNGHCFINLMKEICEQFKIAHQNSTSYRPQINGAVEAANKNIKKILRKIVDSHKQWHKKLPYALLDYHTTIRTSTAATPYMLVYGSEAVIFAEVEIPSLRIIQKALHYNFYTAEYRRYIYKLYTVGYSCISSSENEHRDLVREVLQASTMVFEEGHHSYYSIHPRSTKAYHDIKEIYWWHRMNKDLVEFAAQYPNCQHVNVEH
ncbi:uncharacterized protein LOC129869778 [Solanum dulcamara]|uniref:uncharacterized protein LOC129869778 n=1 Tax=Solanum dulcamara TaxID=45834 RepID=UPI0024869928|nr:uncharacterized protein LOC129869778 [Solanum dulcamara]